MIVCPNCGVEVTDADQEGQLVCTNCGCLIDEHDIISGVEFTDNGGGANIVGQIVSENGSFPFTPGRYTFKESREVTLANGRKRISQIAAGLNLQPMVDFAHRIFSNAVTNNFTQGRKASHVCAACLYIVCRMHNNPTMLIDFADLLQTDVWSLGSIYIKLCKSIGYKLKLIDPSLFIHRFASQLEFGDKLPAVSLTAVRLTKRMERDWITKGRRPLGIVAAALLLAARIHGFRRTKKDILSVIKISDETLRARLLEFESTAASSLTIEEFNKLADQTNDFAVDDKGEAIGDDGILSSHPPSYIKNRLKDQATQQLIADSQSDMATLENDLVENGTLTPGSHLMKERKSSRVSQMKQHDLESLYMELENEMEAALNEPSSHSPLPEESVVPVLREQLSPLLIPVDPVDPVGPVISQDPNNGTNPSMLQAAASESQIYDKEIEEMLLTKEEQEKKSELWLANNQDWIEKQELKKKQMEENPKRVTKRKKRPQNHAQYKHPIRTAAEGLKSLVEQKKVSKNINYEVMKGIFN